MKNTVFEGMATAIVTPMTRDGIDFDALGRFIDFQIESGINAIVVMGTTGENATIEYADQKEIIRYTVERVAKRVPVIAGTGTNNTDHVLHNTRNACEVGVDAILVVTPYYNKATQNGLYQHFWTVAEASTVPVILYNVPGRTGCNLLPKTVARLAEHERIVAIKEATGNNGNPLGDPVHGVADDLLLVGIFNGGIFAGGTHDHDGVDAALDLEVNKTAQGIKIDAVTGHGGYDGCGHSFENRLFHVISLLKRCHSEAGAARRGNPRQYGRLPRHSLEWLAMTGNILLKIKP